jgi:hypothetical protein
MSRRKGLTGRQIVNCNHYPDFLFGHARQIQIVGIFVQINFLITEGVEEGFDLIAVFKTFDQNNGSDGAEEMASPSQNVKLHTFHINFDSRDPSLCQRDEGIQTERDAPGTFTLLPTDTVLVMKRSLRRGLVNQRTRGPRSGIDKNSLMPAASAKATSNKKHWLSLFACRVFLSSLALV